LFIKSLKTGKIPDDWKKANITAIHKKGDRKKPGNYRPVSLTSIVCKLMEQLVKENILQHMIDNVLICNEQHGFLSGRSCVTNMLETLDYWTKLIDEKKPIDVLYLDFKKAFDTVPHGRLITKLRMYNIHPETVQWVEDFLSDRQQRVCINGDQSDWSNVSSGIPQGSVLGPILFIIYINDLPKDLISKTNIFADDTKASSEVDETGNTKLQTDIDTLQAWTDKWQLQFNVDKCSILHLGKNNPKHTYTMNIEGHEEPLKATQSEKDLGITVDEKLGFKAHTQNVTKNANKVLGVINRNFKYLPEKHYVGLYKTMVRSKLEYGNAVWSPMFESEKDRLERVQRRATKNIKRLRDMSYSQRLMELKLPTLEYRRFRGDLIQTYKILHKHDNMDGTFFTLNRNSTARGHSLKLSKYHCNTRLRQHFFSQRVTNSWNQLPEATVSATNINSFKNGVDKFYKEKYSYAKWT
jgi:hypothetical protein